MQNIDKWRLTIPKQTFHLLPQYTVFIVPLYSVYSITHKYANLPPVEHFYRLHCPVGDIFYHPTRTPANNREAASVC